MTKKNLIYKNKIFKKHLDTKYENIFSKKIREIFNNINNEIENPEETLNVLSNSYKFNFSLQDLKKFRKYKSIAIIGMGGSILGAEAIFELFKKKIKKNFYFLDDLNSEKILNFKKKKLSSILFVVISKSGNTAETISNLFALNLITNKSKNIIIITEKKENLIYSLSKKYNLFYIQHKSHVGGRYSVLSEVGIVPTFLMGLNTKKLRANISSFLKKSKKQFLKESSIKLACLLKKKRITNMIFLNYTPELEKFLFWCQQLIAESLGKKETGFLPVISNNPKDHHSLLQLYLDGKKDKIFYIFSTNFSKKVKINTSKITKKNFYLNKKSLSEIKYFQKEALKKVFEKNKIPYREFNIKKLNESVLGELFSYFILETVIIAKLININPFDQPAVEQVKIFTKKLLN